MLGFPCASVGTENGRILIKAWCYVLGSVKFTKTYDADKLN